MKKATRRVSPRKERALEHAGKNVPSKREKPSPSRVKKKISAVK